MSWHGEHRAVCVFSFDVDAESPILAHSANYADHAMTMTHQAYGPRVGVRRILAMLAEYDLKATFFVPGLTAERYPHVVEAALSGGHEVAHHSYSHRNASTMAPGDERADFERALKVLQAQGAELKGHRAGLWEASWETPGLVAEYGLLYDSSLMDDDKPYVLDVGGRKIAELPPHWSLDDWEQYAYVPDPMIGAVIESPVKVLEMWKAELEAMRRHQCLFMLTCHPFLSGRPSRLEALRSLIEFALSFDDVEILTAEKVATRALADTALVPRSLEPVVIEPGLYPN
ncbi:MAG: polysaccharide deacetylase [Acidimicrobiales bacterium]|jgi:peptidoglycan/xylan/chitin deacetylase (PgdA/CDA1 family)